MFIDTRDTKTEFSPAQSLPRRIKAALAHWTAQYLLACEVAEERRMLARMDSESLSDIGISPDAARAEARRSFWDIKGVSRPIRR